MQVIFLPSGSGPSRNLRLRPTLVGIVAAMVLGTIGAGGAYLGYSFGERQASPATVAELLPDTIFSDAISWSVAAAPEPRASNPGTHPSMAAGGDSGDGIVYKIVTPGTEKVEALRLSLNEQRQMLHESRRRLSDHIDSLGQRLGQVQAHVSRLNALGQRLTDMAGLDREEFSFDNLPAIGGPEPAGPWEGAQSTKFSETLQLIEIALRDKENELSVLEALLRDRELHEKQFPQGWPTSSGWLSSAYGHRTDPFTGRKAFHEGVDIAARSGSEIRAMADGVVSFSGRKSGYGLIVEINHGNGYETRYAHAKELIAKVGDRVTKGDTVALVGSTGRSTGSHVHFEVIQNGKTINPHDHLNASS
ncbi:MAG: M23 family metallopeptidase [Gammaproteobacteria bacterium]|nr:M23 family metallopeptidase [Gammaproteobacteria bacterium]